MDRLTKRNTPARHELPWDGVTDRDYPETRIAAIAARLPVWLLLVLMVSFPSGPIMSQSTIPPSEVVNGKREKLVLHFSQEARLMAEEYLDLLKQLRVLSDDYRDYFTAAHTELAEVHLKELSLLAHRLDEGEYLSDPEKLTVDIDQVQRAIEKQQADLKKSDRRAFRLTHSLQQELEVMRALLDEQTVQAPRRKKESSLQMEELLEVIRVATEAGTEGLSGTFIMITTDHDGDTISISLDELCEIPLPAIVGLEPLPALRQPVVVPAPREIEFISRSAGSGVVREFVDSIRVTSNTQPIYIDNPIGDLEISGWDRPEIVVVSTVEVTAESRAEAKKYAERVALQTRSEADKIQVEVIVPSLTDPRISVTNSELRVSVPNRNPLIVTGSFGKVYITKVRGGVILQANYSPVEIDNVDGHVVIVNTMARVDLSRITGTIKVTNSYGPIEVSRCHGDMEIENSFSSTELSYCEGNVVIHSSGDIDVLRHSGSVHIENKNGRVEVTKLEGNLSVSNSFQLLSVEDIFGSAELKNNNASIRIFNVTGEISADNSYGSISGELLSGPLHLTNRKGSIDVTLAEKVTGPSTIDASFGSIRLAVWPGSDLLLQATTTGGDIQSHYPLDVVDSGLIKKTRLSLGKGSSLLTVTGGNSEILIEEAR
ncbi:MAG: DUF4097 family beta strand repeat-containing protein [bacterium]